MWNRDKNFATRGFSTPPPTWKSGPSHPLVAPMSERKRISPANNGDFHVLHKVPAGDSPYVRAKQVQLIDKDPCKAISLFWAAINAGDRVDSALKDMAVVMKQLNRSDEAIEAIKSFRHLCPYDTQESINNVLVELYKRAGRIEEEIEMLQTKLKRIEEGTAFGGRRTKTARSQGRKVQITIEQERSRILGNLAWAYMQQGKYMTAEEHYKKALSLEPDKNKQCNLALCLMYMNRITEAKSLLQAVRASCGNKQMDESYAKSFERAFQMLTELETQSVLRPVEQDGNCCKEISRSSMSSINRNLKQVNSLTNGGQHYVSEYMYCRRWEDGHEEGTVVENGQHRESYCGDHFENKDSFFGNNNNNKDSFFGNNNNTSHCVSVTPGSCSNSSLQNLPVDKWKKDYDFKNSGESRSSFSSRMKEKQGGMNGTEITPTPHGKTYFSPSPARWNPEVPFTQPRRSLWGFNDGHQGREIWGRDVGSSNKKLPFEQCSITETVRPHVVRNLNEDLRASTKSGVSFQTSECSFPSPISRDWRRPQGDAGVRSVLQPISSGNWKGTSRGNDGYFQAKDEAMMNHSSQQNVNGDWKKITWENGGLKKPQMVDENAKALEISTDGGQNQSSDTTVLGSGESMNAAMEDCFGKNSSGKLDNVHQPLAESQKPTPAFSKYSNGKKSWADMVEEEEQGLFGKRTDYFDDWNSEDEFNDENLNSNITPESPCLQTQMKNPTARRSLCFDQQQKPASIHYINSSPVPKEALNFEGSNSVMEDREGSIFGKHFKLKRRNRLQSFQDITQYPDSP